MSFFDCSIPFRLRAKDLERIEQQIAIDDDLKNVSQFIRIAILKELKRREYGIIGKLIR